VTPALAITSVPLLVAVVVLPLTFLGAVYYPWSSLEAVPWLQWLVLVNPLVYVSEGLRAALTPSVPTMPPLAFLAALGVATLALGAAGMRGFLGRTIG